MESLSCENSDFLTPRQLGTRQGQRFPRRQNGFIRKSLPFDFSEKFEKVELPVLQIGIHGSSISFLHAVSFATCTFCLLFP